MTEKKEKEAKADPEQQLDEYKDLLQRLQADFENYKKRVQRDNENEAASQKRKLIVQLLPIIDSFELAMQNANDPEKFKRGIELLFAQFYGLLEAMGLRKITALGEKLDPYRHEVMMHEPSRQDGIILEEFQPGYQLGDAVIRTSKVKVGVHTEEKQNGENNRN